jgi:hypothetical protein
MKWLGMLSVLVAAFFITPLSYAQLPEEENVRYERLKVLEPIIGTWASTGTDQQTRQQTETVTTYSWSPSKKMIVSASRQRQANIGEDLSTQKWNDGGPRIFFVWNSDSACIEQVCLFTGVGRATVHKVISKGEGVFELTRIHPAPSSDTNDAFVYFMTLTSTELSRGVTNPKDAQSATPDNRGWVMIRQNESAGDK